MRIPSGVAPSASSVGSHPPMACCRSPSAAREGERTAAAAAGGAAVEAGFPQAMQQLAVTSAASAGAVASSILHAGQTHLVAPTTTAAVIAPETVA